MNRRKGRAERPLPTLRSLPRRFILVFALALALVLLLILTLPSGGVSAVPYSAADLQQHVQQGAKHAKQFFINPNLPKIYNPFGEKAHQAPEQKDSKLGSDRWYSDLKWLNPFSSAVTLDPDRAVLPPLLERTPIYTYYDGSASSDKVKVAENELLLAWRRSWWAQGFRPVVLGRADARKNAAWYKVLQDARLKPSVEKELERWLAWKHMGGGILSNWLLFPMAKHDDSVLSFLRRGSFDRLTNFHGLGAGLFCASSDAVETTLKAVFEDPTLPDREDFFQALPKKLYDSAKRHEGLAYYDLPTITAKYGEIAKELAEDEATGMHKLSKLINSHLHRSWQTAFPNGIAIAKVYPARTTTLVASAVRLGQILRQCPASPDPESCPPNKSSCKPCDPEHPPELSVPPTFVNDTEAFTIVPVPHPFTFNSIIHERGTLSVSYVRRHTERDPWIVSITSSLNKKGMFGTQRLVTFKEAVAGESGTSNSLWFTAEREDVLEWDWIFGFKLPEGLPKDSPIDIQAHLMSGSRAAFLDELDSDFPDYEQLAAEKAYMDHALSFLKSKSKADMTTRSMIEAWNMADTEAWRFVRAFNSRRKLERQQWEAQEKHYAGAENMGRRLDHR